MRNKRILCDMGKAVTQISDYSKSYEENFLAYGGNTGNFLFNYALEKYVTNGGAESTFIGVGLNDYEFINENFDLVLVSAANMINPKIKDDLKVLAKKISKIKVPVYYIGLGLQTEITDTEYKFLNKISSEVCVFIDSVYETGGNFALRGHKTAEVFEKLGYSDYTVTGCPSMFINGRNLQIAVPELTRENLKPLLNNTQTLTDKCLMDNFRKYPESVFVDQDRFYRILFRKEKHPIKYSDIAIRLRFNQLTLDLLKQDRIKLFADIPMWTEFIKNGNYNFSFGSRIHGNVVPLLCGVPSFISCGDMRTLELAEFFDIPHSTLFKSKTDLFDVYQSLDYTEFNNNFAKKFDNFQNFFNKHNIPCDMSNSQDNKFDKYVSALTFDSSNN